MRISGYQRWRALPSGSGARTIVALGAVVALVAALGACSGGDQKRSASERVLRIGVTAAPASLDPAKGRVERLMRPLAYESLVQQRPDGSYGPGLATKWRYLNDNATLEFTLRDGARFSDGTPVDADAVKQWLEYFPTANGPFVSRMGALESVEAVDKRTVRLNLAAPNPAAHALIAVNNWGAVASSEAVADPGVLGSKTFGAGPYTLDPSATVSDDHYTFVPNKHYYDKSKIKFSQIVVKVIAKPSSMLQAAQSGQLEVAVGDASTADAAKGAGFDIVHAPTATQGLVFGDRNGKIAPAMGDVRVRQALNYAVDRKAITKALAGRYGTPSSQMPSPDGWDPAYQDYYEYDPAKAKALLAKAGYPNGFTLKLLEASRGSALTQAVAKYFKAVGVKVDVTTAATDGDYVRKVQAKKFPLVNQALPADYTMWQWYIVVWKPGTLWNFTDWRDPLLTKLALDGAQAADGAKYWVEMSRRATEQAYFLPLYKDDSIYYVSKDIGGVEASEKGAGQVFVPAWSPK